MEAARSLRLGWIVIRCTSSSSSAAAAVEEEEEEEEVVVEALGRSRRARSTSPTLSIVHVRVTSSRHSTLLPLSCSSTCSRELYDKGAA